MDYYLKLYSYFELNKVVGLSAPQGSGKSTIARVMQYLFELDGKSCVYVSLDDLYHTFDTQQKIAKEYPENPLLQYRGNPGTHDIALGVKVLQSLKEGRATQVPRYDKTAKGGLGDRTESEFVHGPVDTILLEGWCLGFQPVLDEKLMQSPALLPINEALMDFERLHEQLDTLVVLRIECLDWVYVWREEAESNARNTGRGAMTKDQVKDFVDRFFPVYKQYLPQLYASANKVIDIGQNRLPYPATTGDAVS